MVNYSGLHHHLRSGKSKESTSPSLRGTNASMASSSGSTTSISSFSDALIDDATLSNDPYFHFSTDQQDALLEDARSTATALIVDTLSGFDKWRFLTMTSKVQLFELKSDAADRVSTMRSDDPHALGAANQSHTLLAITRVRAKLDDFMRIAATDKRDKFQNFLACLHDGEVQHADVFTAFGNLQSTSSLSSSSGVTSHNSSSADVLSSSFTSNSSFDSSRGMRSGSSGVDAEQYAIKYYSLKEPKASKASSARHGGGMASKFMHRSKSKASSRSLGQSATGSDGLTLCVGEYATIRQGKIRASSLKGSSGSHSPEDHRIGIIASHSVDDPQVTRYCKPIASTTGAGFAVTSRSFAQFSGLVAYPVASSAAGESVLEVVVKLSCFDANGVSALKKQAMMQYLVAYRHLEHALLVLRLHDSPFLSSVNWTKSDQRKGCNVCHQSFPSFRRKHHCRLCGEVVCSKCSSMHALKVAKAGKVAFRICSACRHGASSSSSMSGHTHALAPSRKPHSDSDDDDEEEDVVEVDSQLEPIVRSDAPVPQPQDVSRASRHETPSVPLLHKQQLEQHDSRHARRTGSLSADHMSDGASTTADADAKHRAASTESSNESEFNDSRGFLSSNVTATTAASTPPSASASPLSSPTGSPLAASALSSSALQQSQQQYEQQHEPQYEPLQSYHHHHEPQYQRQYDSVADYESDERASELSVRDFHDSEFALDLSDLHLHTGPSTRKHSGVFAIDEDFEEEEEDEEDEAPVTRSAATTEPFSVGYSRLADDDEGDEIQAYDDAADDDDTGFEFHDSEVGITFHLEDLEEFNDAKYEALEEIQEISTASAALVQRNRLLDELRRTRLMDYSIMDSSREASYDLIALQAAQFMGCALASVSFVDDRREFVKAAAGDVMLPGRSHGGGVHDIPKHQSLAAHIVQRCAADDLSLVLALDASHDEALAANPFVYDAPFVRFVVGVPLRTRDGVVLGALLVADTRPRRRGLSPTEMQVLQGFAEQLNELLDERWQRQMYQRRAAPAPEQIQQTLQSLLSQSYHTGQQLRQQQQHAFHQSLPVPRAHRHLHHHQPRYQPMAPAVHTHARESVHSRLTMQGIEL